MTAQAPAYDTLRADYLRAVGIEHTPAPSFGPCHHEPPHIIRVEHPTDPEAPKVRVLLDCSTRPLMETLR